MTTVKVISSLDPSQAEIGRVLKPQSGRLALIWNLEDRESNRWVGQIRDVYEIHEAGTPQYVSTINLTPTSLSQCAARYRHGYWKAIFETAAFKKLFNGFSERHVMRGIPTTDEGVVDRVTSKSYIADLEPAVRDEVVVNVREVLAKADDKKWIDRSTGSYEYPYQGDLYLLPRNATLV